jgi:hypothetical protein
MALVLALGCTQERVFVCTTNEECVDGDVLGFCQPAHVCSFPDDGCPSLQRYGSRAPDALAEQCVAGDLVSALAARWAFDEGTGKAVRDTSGHGVDAEIDRGAESVSGVWGSALFFDGSGTPVTAPGDSTRFGDASFSGAAWVRAGAAQVPQSRIIGRGFDVTGPGGYIFLNFGDGNPFTEFRDSLSAAWDVSADGVNLGDEAWHHIGFVLDRSASVITIFVDGVREESRAIDSTGVFGDPNTQDEFLIGAQNGNPATAMKGDIDEVWIYTRALTDADMAALYQGPGLARPKP